MKTTHYIISRSISTALGMLACWFLPICVWASVQVDGIYYELNTSAKTAAVASNPNYYSGTVSIPSSFVYEGVTYRVTSIGSTAFLDCNGMKAIYMPSSVTSIASSAFERCKGLTNLKIGSGVTTINYEAFKNCSNLTSLILPASVKTISDEVFSGCTSLTEIVAERTTAPTISSTTFNGVDKTSCTVYVPEGYRSSYANAANWKTFSNIVERTVVATGSCGDNVTYTIYSDMSMVISGAGAIKDYGDYNTYINNDYYHLIKKVIIGEGVTSIGACAFSGFTSLISVSIPNSVTNIGMVAFSGCTGLTSITIPNSVMSIGEEAFYGCTGLTSVTIPDGITFIDNFVFDSCTGLTSVTIPNSVIYIGWCAFGRTGLTSVNIPNGVKNIGEGAFVLCKNLISVNIPNSVTGIYEDAFSGCSALTSVNIPNSVAIIDWGAFKDCTGLTSVTIGSSVTRIGGRAFEGCIGLTSITVDAGNSTYDSRNNCNAIIETATNTLIVGCKNTIIPNSVTAIGYSAFDGCTGLTSITIPNSVTAIDNSAFEGCTGLTSVTFHCKEIQSWFSGIESIEEVVIGDEVTDIGESALSNCTGLTSVSIPSSVTSIGNYAFAGCTNLSFISIPNSVTSIGDYAFAECFVLTSVKIPDSVTSIGDWAFFGCDHLSSLTIPNSVTRIGRGAFDDTAWFSNQPDGLVYINQVAYQYKGTMPDWTYITINSGTVSISGIAFYGCSGLSSITIPNSVIDIGDYAFSGCTRLYTITVERESPAPIGEYAFSSVNKSYCTLYVPFGCKSAYENAEGWREFEYIEESRLLVGNLYYRRDISDNTVIVDRIVDNNYSGSLTIPESINYAGNSYTVTSIGNSAFSGCTGLTSITIPNSVTEIGSCAFSGCSGLTSIEIPNSVTSIDGSAFSNCTGLTSIEIPNSVIRIGYDAFYGCTGLTSVSIPNSVTSIEDNAFRECSALTSVTIPNSVSSIGERAFENCISLSSVNLPASVYIDYNSDEGYIDYIGDRAFYGCSSLKSLVIPEGVQTIGVGVFEECYNLSLTLPSSLSSISTFSWPDEWDSYRTESGFIGVKSIIVDNDNPVFDSRDNCNAVIETATNKLLYGSKLTKVPDGVTTIGHYSLCNVSSIFIPSSVETIEAGAFCLSRDFWFYDDWERNHETREYDYSSYLLDSIIMESDVPPSASFSGVDQETCLLLVPFGSKSAYQNASGWKDFQNIIEFEPDTDISALDNAIYVEKTEGRIGGTMDIPVKLKNSYPVRGFQFRLELPEGTTINEWSLSTNRLPSGATLSDKIATQKIEGNKINVACTLNYGDATFMGNDGVIATVNVTFADDMEVGSYPIYLTACDVTTAGGADEDLSDIKSTLVLEDYLQGDANGDGKVRIGDATAILNYIVGSVPGNFQEKAADTNGDGRIRIGDATAVLNIIVNQ